jgi:uncharacterized protein YidB (DUF937 family)
MKKLIATLTAAGLLSLGGAGIAAAQDNGGASSNATPTTQPKAKGAQKAEYRKIRRAARRAALEAAAKAIGVDVKTLRQAVRGGQTIAEFAQSKGVDPSTVVTAIVRAIDAKIDRAVKDGKITEARAAKLKARVPQLADRFVNHVPKRFENTQPTTPTT